MTAKCCTVLQPVSTTVKCVAAATQTITPRQEKLIIFIESLQNQWSGGHGIVFRLSGARDMAAELVATDFWPPLFIHLCLSLVMDFWETLLLENNHSISNCEPWDHLWIEKSCQTVRNGKGVGFTGREKHSLRKISRFCYLNCLRLKEISQNTIGRMRKYLLWQKKSSHRIITTAVSPFQDYNP